MGYVPSSVVVDWNRRSMRQMREHASADRELAVAMKVIGVWIMGSAVDSGASFGYRPLFILPPAPSYLRE
jgi:hypothetical protein